MSIDNKIFEKEGLKIDKERILTYSQLSCPLDCRYCFVEDMNFNQKRDVAYLTEKQFELLGQLPEQIDTIMLGCDTEFFQSKKDSLEVLEKLSDLNKDISVVTKLSLPKDFIKKLKGIDIKLNQHNNFLSFSMSFPCLDSAKEWEPKVPSPESRIETLKIAYETGIKTMVAIRPLLPTVSDKELKQIVELTEDYCNGYYSGPLYLKNLDHPILAKEVLADLKVEELQPHWMPEGNIFYKIEKEGQMDLLKNIIQEYGKPLFEGAAEGIKYLKKYEKH